MQGMRRPLMKSVNPRLELESVISRVIVSQLTSIAKPRGASQRNPRLLESKNLPSAWEFTGDKMAQTNSNTKIKT